MSSSSKEKPRLAEIEFCAFMVAIVLIRFRIEDKSQLHKDWGHLELTAAVNNYQYGGVDPNFTIDALALHQGLRTFNRVLELRESVEISKKCVQKKGIGVEPFHSLPVLIGSTRLMKFLSRELGSSPETALGPSLSPTELLAAIKTKANSLLVGSSYPSSLYYQAGQFHMFLPKPPKTKEELEEEARLEKAASRYAAVPVRHLNKSFGSLDTRTQRAYGKTAYESIHESYPNASVEDMVGIAERALIKARFELKQECRKRKCEETVTDTEPSTALSETGQLTSSSSSSSNSGSSSSVAITGGSSLPAALSSSSSSSEAVGVSGGQLLGDGNEEDDEDGDSDDDYDDAIGADTTTTATATSAAAAAVAAREEIEEDPILSEKLKMLPKRSNRFNDDEKAAIMNILDRLLEVATAQIPSRKPSLLLRTAANRTVAIVTKKPGYGELNVENLINWCRVRDNPLNKRGIKTGVADVQ